MDDGTPLFLRNAGAAASLLAPLLAGAVRESLFVAHVGSDHRLIELVREEEGTRDQVSIPARAILVDAIRLGSSRLILAHCHPSGDPAPSAHDIVATRRLADMAAVVGISLEDHLIFAGGDCSSFRALGLL
jgi:DNA repair protein RadC